MTSETIMLDTQKTTSPPYFMSLKHFWLISLVSKINSNHDSDAQNIYPDVKYVNVFHCVELGVRVRAFFTEINLLSRIYSRESTSEAFELVGVFLTFLKVKTNFLLFLNFCHTF